MATGGSSEHAASTLSNAQLLHRFHQRCGRRITLSNSNRTASRSVRDFSHALVFSAEPLMDDVLFEVVIDKKNNSWGGSIEIGVTIESPDKLELPSCATALRNGSWVMANIDVRKDGLCLNEFYGVDLETLNEQDRVGVMRTSNADLVFYVNGESQGVAARDMPKILWALVDLYGRCVQVSLCPRVGNVDSDCATMTTLIPAQVRHQIVQSIDVPMSVDVTVTTSNSSVSSFLHPPAPLHVFDSNSASTTTLALANNAGVCTLPIIASSNGSSSFSGNIQSQNVSDFYDMNDRMRFHTRSGSLIKLSPNCRSAERRRPLDEFNNGVVMTHRPLRDNELFEIRIDKLVDKWSGSIEVGVTTHNPTMLHFPATMTNMRSGTIMMSGCGILTNGKGTRRQYGEFNLDELREGDRVGMMRKSNNNLHYYINGQDQGVAATRVGATLWGVIDLYGMTIKVTIVDRDEREQQNLVTRRNHISNTAANACLASASGAATASAVTPVVNLQSPESELNSAAAAAAVIADSTLAAQSGGRNDDRLTFHPLCGSHATVTLSGRTALRPNASDDFNNGVVLTKRHLRPNEMFQVRLERVVTKWAGSVEMGVTTHSAEDLDFPFTMTNVRSGTWMMTGNGVMHNGVTVIEQYGQNLDRLQVGDRVGVVRKDDGTLHFWVNGVDQGPAASKVPEKVYGVIDLYGQAAQASIIDTSECGSPDTGNSTISNTTLYSEQPLRFHAIHGKNACISNGGLTASRPNSLAEFNDAILFSNRPLRQRELFEVVLETMVRHWSGNIEIGVTGTRPEDIQLAANATDLDTSDTIILCGSMIFHNRKTVRSNVVIDLDTLGAGTRVGVMRNGDFIHFYIDGVDQGSACECRMSNVWAVIDLYGQCAQASLVQTQSDLMRAPYATSENSQSCQATSVIQPATLETKHRWTCISGNVTLSQNWTVASRATGQTAPLSRCLVFSEHTLQVGSPFEIKLLSFNGNFAGCFNIGVTDLNLTDDYVRKNIPIAMRRIPANVWYLTGNEMRYNQMLVGRSMASLEWLRVGDRVALELTPMRTLRILLNSEDMNIQFHNIPNDVYVAVELMGTTMSVQAISTQAPTSPLRPCSLRLQDSLDFGVDPLNKQDSMLESIDSELQNFEFSDYHGKNIQLQEDRRSAKRTQSYNQALVFITKPLCKGDSISIKVDAINTKWKGTIGLGVLGVCPQNSNTTQLPPSLMNCKRPCWVATHDYININGQRIPSSYGSILEQIEVGTVITMTLTHTGLLVMMMGSLNLEDLAGGLPSHVYPVFDLYGKCEKISIISGSDIGRNGTPIIEEADALEHDINDQECIVPQCEKANLEVHEKETEQSTETVEAQTVTNGAANAMNRSVLENVTENLNFNISVKNRSMEHSRIEPSTSCCLRESLQLQHNTNLNIQRSQSTQRFQNAMSSSVTTPTATSSLAASTSVSVHDTNKEIEALEDEGAVGIDHLLCKDSLCDINDENNLALQQQDRNNELDNSQLSDRPVNVAFTELTINTSAVASAGAVGGVAGNTEQQRMDEKSLECDECDVDNAVGCSENMQQLLQVQQQQFQNDLVRTQYHQQNQMLQHQPASLSMELLTTASSSLQFEPITTLPALLHRNCEYLRIVQQFRASLVLPQSFFQPSVEPICFCLQCNANAAEKLQNWVYFKLNQQTVNRTTTTIAVDTVDWLPLFYMSRVDKIRAILDNGQPLPLESNCDTQASSGTQKDQPGRQLELHYSPNANGIVAVNSPHKFKYNSHAYSIDTAFEVYVRKQSLSAGANSSTTINIVAGERRPSQYSSDVNNASSSNESDSLKDMSWFTKEADACVITALILKVEKVKSTSTDV